jgi:lipopolysaccharide assembly outer membrane protein LptD (OstA)
MVFLAGLTSPLFADAYLSEERVYYGADTYNINYKDEVINAHGNAYFKKENAFVYADRIVIYYGDEKKMAVFNENVIIRDKDDNIRIRGDYGEAYFKDDEYIVEGNVTYVDDTQRVTSKRCESRGLKTFTFHDDIVYNNEEVTINARLLDVDENDTAYFRDDVHAVFTESGDELFCSSIVHDIETGNSDFREDVLYIQRSSPDNGEAPLIVRSEVAQYFHDTDLFLLMNRVFLSNGQYSLTGPMVKYFRNRRTVQSIGETIVFDGLRTIYCNHLELNLDSRKFTFFDSIRGILRAE